MYHYGTVTKYNVNTGEPYSQLQIVGFICDYCGKIHHEDDDKVSDQAIHFEQVACIEPWWYYELCAGTVSLIWVDYLIPTRKKQTHKRLNNACNSESGSKLN